MGCQKLAYLSAGRHDYNSEETSLKCVYRSCDDQKTHVNEYFFGARNYNPAIGRWMVPDPMAEKYTSYSGYNYVLNNPISMVDPFGMEAELMDDYNSPHEPQPGYIPYEGDYIPRHDWNTGFNGDSFFWDVMGSMEGAHYRSHGDSGAKMSAMFYSWHNSIVEREKRKKFAVIMHMGYQLMYNLEVSRAAAQMLTIATKRSMPGLSVLALGTPASITIRVRGFSSLSPSMSISGPKVSATLASMRVAPSIITIDIKRIAASPESTVSEFTVNRPVPLAPFKGYFLEPGGPSTTTRNQDRRIPAGNYLLTPFSSTSHSNHYILSNSFVSRSRGILIHSGNYHGDTAGCLLPGDSYSMVNGNYAVWNSVSTLNSLRNIIGTSNATINITDYPTWTFNWNN